MSNKIRHLDVAINKAFAHVVPDVEKAPADATLVGYEGFDGHPHLAGVMSDGDFLFDKPAFQTLAYAWDREWTRKATDPRRGVWFGGPKGAGKTTMCEQFFARLGVPVVQLTCNRRIPLSDLIDKMMPDGSGGWIQIPGPLKVAMQMGLPVILNEPSRMEPADLVAMHDIIDRGILVCDDGEVVRAAQGFLVFATDNTMGFGDETGAYPDANVLDQATLSRFLKVEVDYPSAEMEARILESKVGTQKDVARLFVSCANAIRASYIAGKSAVTMGTRELIDWASAAEYFVGYKDEPPAVFAFKRVMGGVPAAEMRAMLQTLEAHFGATS